MVLVAKLLSRVLQPVLKKVFLVEGLAKFSFQSNLHRLLKCTVDLLEMENLVFKLLDLINVTEMLRVTLHLTRWFRVLVNQSILQLLLVIFKPQDPSVDILDFLL